MKPLETIIKENEYAHISFWADKYVDLIGNARPQRAHETLVRMEENPTSESAEVVAAIKETGLDRIMYPFYRNMLIGHGLLTPDEVEAQDRYAASYGRPCATPEELEATKDGILTTMIDSKNRILGMSEEDPLYGMYQTKGGETLRQDIVNTQSHIFATSFDLQTVSDYTE